MNKKKQAICYSSVSLSPFTKLFSVFILPRWISSLFPSFVLLFSHFFHSSHILKCYFLLYHHHNLVQDCLSSSDAFLLLSIPLFESSLSSLASFRPHVVFSVRFLLTRILCSLILGSLFHFPFYFAFFSGSLSLFIMSLSSSPPPYLI